MQYLALIYADEEVRADLLGRGARGGLELYRAFGREAEKAGVLAGGNELGATRDATTVRVRDNETLVTDGPYAEVKEGSAATTCSSARRWTKRSTGPPASRARTTARSRYAPSTSTPRRHSCELRAAHLRRRLVLGRSPGGGQGEAPSGRDAPVAHSLRRAPQDRSRISGNELDGRSTAKVVRVRNGERIVTDGPFAETKEILGGVFLTELPDLDEAIRLAALVPTAGHGCVEIRPVLQ